MTKLGQRAGRPLLAWGLSPFGLLTSGEISCAGSCLRLGQRQWSDSGARGLGIFTVDGENAVANLNWLSLGQRPAPSFGVANLNRGVLAVKTSIGRMPTNQGETFYNGVEPVCTLTHLHTWGSGGRLFAEATGVSLPRLRDVRPC